MINITPPDENMPDLGGGVGAGQNAEKHVMTLVNNEAKKNIRRLLLHGRGLGW